MLKLEKIHCTIKIKCTALDIFQVKLCTAGSYCTKTKRIEMHVHQKCTRNPYFCQFGCADCGRCTWSQFEPYAQLHVRLPIIITVSSLTFIYLCNRLRVCLHQPAPHGIQVDSNILDQEG